MLATLAAVNFDGLEAITYYLWDAYLSLKINIVFEFEASWLSSIRDSEIGVIMREIGVCFFGNEIFARKRLAFGTNWGKEIRDSK